MMSRSLQLVTFGSLLLSLAALVEHHGNLIKAVRNRIQVGRVFLVHDDILGFNTTAIAKVLARMDIAAGFLGADTLDCEMIDEIPAPTLFVLLSSNNVMREFLLEVSQHSDTMAGNKWLMLTDYGTDEYSTNLVKFFENVHVPFDCEFLVTEETEGEEVNVRAVYHFKPKLPLRDRHYGTWYRQQQKWIPNGLYKLSRSNLENLKIRTAYKEKRLLFKPESPYGYFGLIWKSLEEALNFTSDFMLVKERHTGVRLDNNTWTGMIGVFLQNKLDAIGGDMEMTSERLDVLTFLDPLYEARKVVFIKKEPSYDEVKWQAYFSPFGPRLWMVITSAIAAFALSLIIAGRLAPGCKPYPVSEAFLATIACFCAQGRDETPQSWAGKLLFLTSYLTGVIVLAGYSASVISGLASSTATLPFTDFKSMLKNGRYLLAMPAGSYLLDVLENSEDPILKRVVRELVPPRSTFPRNTQNGILEMCKKKNLAFIVDELTWKMGIYNISCEILPIPQAFIPQSLSMALENNSAYRGVFNSITRRMRQTGLLDILQRRTIPQMQPLEDLEESMLEVTLFDIVPLLSVLFGGIVIACSLLLIEILVAQSEAKQNSNSFSSSLRRYRKRASFSHNALC